MPSPPWLLDVLPALVRALSAMLSPGGKENHESDESREWQRRLQAHVQGGFGQLTNGMSRTEEAEAVCGFVGSGSSRRSLLRCPSGQSV